MSKLVTLALLAFLLAALGLGGSRVWGVVESADVSPSVSAVGQPITFSGMDVAKVYPNNPMNLVFIYIYPGYGCSFKSSNSIAFTITSVNSAGTYSSTLSFPVPVLASGQGYSGGWVVASPSYQDGLPPGNYSVGITDAETLMSNPSGGICKYFTITNSLPTSEFSDTMLVACSALIASLVPLLFLRRRRRKLRSLQPFGKRQET